MVVRVGQQLGKYRLLKMIGQGGFADVYLGEHILLKSLAAIKLLNTQQVIIDVQSFLDEARTLASLKHPHIIGILDFDIEGGTIPYLVMEYAPRGTLRQQHPTGLLLSLKTILPYVEQITSALEYVHQHKLIHCDVKPENLLIGHNDQILLSDFGIAVQSASSGLPYAHGTVAYMAPEQFLLNPSPASDQYSLGVVVYEWLSGTCPFTGATAQEIINKQITSPPASLQLLVPTIPAQIDAVVLKALSKDPQQRFASVLDFAHALKLASQSIQPGNTPTLPLSKNPAPTTPLISQFQAAPTLPSSLSPNTLPSSPSPNTLPSSPSPSTLPSFPSPNTLPSSPSPNTLPSAKRKRGDILHIYKEHTNFVRTVAWSPDGTRIASGDDDHQVHIWDALTGKNSLIYKGHSDQVRAICWLKDGKRIVSGSADQLFSVWDADTGTMLFVYKGHFGQAKGVGLVCPVACSPDGKYIVSGSADWTAQVWNADTGDHLHTYHGHNDDINAVAWSPSGDRLVTASHDKTIRVWDYVTKVSVFEYKNQSHHVRAVAWSPDGTRIASAGDDRRVHVWDMPVGGQGKILIYAHHGKRVNTVAWSPDGKYLASGGNDQTIQIWSATDGNHIYTYHGHTDEIKALVWSPDGRLIASASDDQTVQIWQAMQD